MRCPETFLVEALANALLPIGDGRRVNESCAFFAELGEPDPADKAAKEASVRTEDRFLIESGSMMLGGLDGSPFASALAFGVFSVLSTLVGSKG